MQGFDVHPAFTIEREACNAPEHRDILVLLADGLPQPVDLDFAGLLREVLFWHDLFLESMQACSSPVIKLPDEPRPVPAGISDMLVISRYCGFTCSILNASRISGCWMSSI